MTTLLSKPEPLSVTDRAALRIAEIVKAEPGKTAFRVAVLGGGCSGFQYEFSLAEQSSADDVVIEKNGARVFVDHVSAPYLQGSQLDFVDELIGASFKISNPNATASCGCGTSFSV